MDDRVLRLNRPPRCGITTLGYGRRVAIWTQGCDLACPGCVSRDTWPSGGDAWSADDLADLIADPASGLDGLTISGGEPFAQPQGLAALLGAVRQRTDPTSFDILCFSGHRREHLEASHPEVVAMLDALVDGRFRSDLPTELPLRGSANQRVHRLTPLAHRRYGAVDEPAPRPDLQVIFDDESVELVGIPARGQMEAIEHALSLTGIRLEGASWRS